MLRVVRSEPYGRSALLPPEIWEHTPPVAQETICCAYVPVPNVEVTPTILRKELSTVLPSYMLPSR